MDKSIKVILVERVINLLSEKVKSLEESLTDINDAINNAPGAMQSHSDTTRSQLTSVMNTTHKTFNEKNSELGFLRNFSKMDLNKIKSEKVKTGIIVVLKKENNVVENYFLLPGGSGVKLDHKGDKFICLTLASPLGKALVGKEKNKSFLFNVGGMSQRVTILDLI